MKKTLLLLLFAGTLHASESFVLNIPVRFNANQETGKVLVTLTLDSAPAGAQLVVNGATTLNLGQTQTIAGDSVAFESGGGNDVKITYIPLSNFGADFCAGGSAVEKNIPLRFAGAQDVTDYRVSTYIVAAPAAECSQASKRTGDTPATIVLTGDGVAPTLSATFRGRHPFDIVLVLDKSGSMADLPPDALPSPTNPSKADILKSAITSFVGVWEQMDAPTPNGSDYSHDRLAVVMFDSTPQSQTLTGADPPANVFLKRGSGTAWDAVSSNVTTLTPGSSTSIGGGINEAMQQWKNDPQSDLQLVVVTDGMQNTAPLIQPTATGFLGLTPVAGLPQELRERFVPIHSIGFGTPATVDATLLANLALETAGVSFLSINATTIFNTFANTLVAILKGNTASIAVQQSDTMSGTGPSATIPVIVDGSVQRAVFSVQWAPPFVHMLDLEVFPPGQSTPATPTSSKKTPQASIQTFDLKPGLEGTWHVRVKRAPDTHKDTLPYALNVFFLEKDLDYSFSFDDVHAATGDKIRVRALVAYDGRPLAKLPPDAIRLRIQRPSEGLGNILRASDASGQPAAGGDPKDAYHAKVARITNAKLLARVMPKDFTTISLKEDGRGFYSAVFDKTEIAGLYAFNAMLDWKDPRTGRVHRIERLEHTVRVKVDRTRTTVVSARSGSTVQLTITPRDKFGNYLGPGYASAIHAVDFKDATAVDRKQNGTYTLIVRDVARNAKVRVMVDGVAVN